VFVDDVPKVALSFDRDRFVRLSVLGSSATALFEIFPSVVPVRGELLAVLIVHNNVHSNVIERRRRMLRRELE